MNYLNILNSLKKWWKQIVCLHDWEERYTSRGVVLLKCKKCGKAENLVL